MIKKLKVKLTILFIVFGGLFYACEQQENKSPQQVYGLKQNQEVMFYAHKGEPTFLANISSYNPKTKNINLKWDKTERRLALNYLDGSENSLKRIYALDDQLQPKNDVLIKKLPNNSLILDVIFLGDTILIASDTAYSMYDTHTGELLQSNLYEDVFQLKNYHHVPLDKARNPIPFRKDNKLLISFAGASKMAIHHPNDFEAFAWLNLNNLKAEIIPFQFPSPILKPSPWLISASLINSAPYFRYQLDTLLYKMETIEKEDSVFNLKKVEEIKMQPVETLFDSLKFPQLYRNEYKISWSPFFRINKNSPIYFTAGFIPNSYSGGGASGMNYNCFVDFYNSNNFTFINRFWITGDNLHHPVFYQNGKLYISQKNTTDSTMNDSLQLISTFTEFQIVEE